MPKPRTVRLVRNVVSRQGTVGELFTDDHWIGFCLELPWRDNRRNVSCIPAGAYTLAWRRSPRFGDRLHVLDIEGRDNVMFHPGNRLANTAGCLLPGDQVGRGGPRAGYEDEYYVVSSRPALQRLEESLPKTCNHKLVIEDGVRA